MAVRRGFNGGRCLSATLVLALFGVSTPSLAAGGACERIVVTGNAQYPPVLWVDPDDSKRLVGAAVELLESALEGSGIHVDVLNVGPWARAQEEVRSGRVDMLAGAFLTSDRLAEMDYVYPPYMEVPSVIFVKRGKAFPYSGWDDLRGKRGSSLVNNSFGAAFDTYAADHLEISTVPSIEQSFELLLRDRADYVVYERHQGLALAAQMNILEQLDVLEGSLINEPLHYTVSHDSACNSPALRAALAQGMHRMVRRGEPRRLLEKYREIWSEQLAPVAQEEPALE